MTAGSRSARAILLFWCGIIAFGAGYLHLTAQQPLKMPAPTQAPRAQGVVAQAPLSERASATPVAPRAVLDKYCVTCHNERLKTAGLLLDKLDVEHVADGAESWEKVARKLRTHEMPPPGRPRPDEATYSAIVAQLENALDVAAAAKPNPGRVSVHRLNRVEYTNAIRD